MNSCSKLLRYVHEIPNAFITRVSRAEPKKLTSRRALWVYIQSTKMRQNSHIGQTFILNSDIRSPFQQSKLFDPFSTIQVIPIKSLRGVC